MSRSHKLHIRRWLVHAYRITVFVFLLTLIHQQHSWFVAQKRGAMKQLITVEQVLSFYPKVDHLSEWDSAHGGQNVLDTGSRTLGYVIQTSPEADHIIGFSGPTNVLIAISKDKRILGTAVLRSDDTKKHLEHVLRNKAFFTQWNGLSTDEAAAGLEIDAVSGASLTSMAIADSIATRFSGSARSNRFPDEIEIKEVRELLRNAHSLLPVEKRPYLLQVLDGEGALLGYALRTSPHTDHMMGYQGPTDVLIILDSKERLTHLAIRSTYDNEPFVSYLTEDEYFFNTFIGFKLIEIADIDMVDAGIDGVTGATKTSITVAESLIQTAAELTKTRKPIPPKPLIDPAPRDIGTVIVVLAGMVIAFTGLRGKRWLRLAFQIILVIYLGFINADMISQSLIVGWAKNGVAWRVAPGLVLLSAAALLVPMFTGRQVYCTHLCPFGAVQDWTARRLPRQVGMKGWRDSTLSCLPVVLLVWVLIIAMRHLPFSLVDIEPFDAFVFRIAGWVTITVAIVGLIASLFVTRAYCRYGCPTGAMLKFIRFNAAADHLGRRDFAAAAFALLALGMAIWR